MCLSSTIHSSSQLEGYIGPSPEHEVALHKNCRLSWWRASDLKGALFTTLLSAIHFFGIGIISFTNEFHPCVACAASSCSEAPPGCAPNPRDSSPDFVEVSH